jgi:hypothetical protein
MTSPTQINRIEQALAETRLLLNKELSYMVQHQKADTIAWYRAHIAKLNAKLDTLLD